MKNLNSTKKVLLSTSFMALSCLTASNAFAVGECQSLRNIYGAAAVVDQPVGPNGHLQCDFMLNNIDEGTAYSARDMGELEFDLLRNTWQHSWANIQSGYTIPAFNAVGTENRTCGSPQSSIDLVKIWRLSMQFQGVPELAYVRVRSIKLKFYAEQLTGLNSSPHFGIKVVKHRFSEGALPVGDLDHNSNNDGAVPELYKMFNEDVGADGYDFSETGLLGSKNLSLISAGQIEMYLGTRRTKTLLARSGLVNIGMVSDYDYNNINPTGLNVDFDNPETPGYDPVTNQSGIVMRVANRQSPNAATRAPRLVLRILEQ